MHSTSFRYQSYAVQQMRHWMVAVFLLLFVGGSSVSASAQAPAEETLELTRWKVPADSALLFSIYQSQHPVINGYAQAAHLTAKPVFLGGVPAAWIGTWAVGGHRWREPYALLLAEGAGYLLQLGLKELFRQPRPYRAYNGIVSRAADHPSKTDVYSFPSGHATVAFAMATSVSLSYPSWYVVAPSVVWAGGVALSRPWLGVHYPSDVLTGALVGTALGVGVHFLAPHIMPPMLK